MIQINPDFFSVYGKKTRKKDRKSTRQLRTVPLNPMTLSEN